MKRVLVAGIGNIFLGDDAFGVELVRHLNQRPVPDQVAVIDFGTRTYDLAFRMLEGYETTILIDATARGHPPGTLYVIELDSTQTEPAGEELANGHSLNPNCLLQIVRMLGGNPRRVLVLGCEPELLQNDQGELRLSPRVQAAIPRAIDLLEKLINELLQTQEPDLAFTPKPEEEKLCFTNRKEMNAPI